MIILEIMPVMTATSVVQLLLR